MTKPIKGYVYAVSQRQVDNFPNYTRVKIGYLTHLNIEQSIHDRYAVSMTPIVIMDIVPVGDGKAAENFIHYLLTKHRVDPVHETFNLDKRFGAWNDFIKAVECMRKIEAESSLPKPMLRKVDYDYWSIAKQAAVKGKNWISRFRQRLKERELEIRKRDKENAKDIKEAMADIENGVSFMPKFFQNIIRDIDKAYSKNSSLPDYFQVFNFGCQHFAGESNPISSTVSTASASSTPPTLIPMINTTENLKLQLKVEMAKERNFKMQLRLKELEATSSK